MSSRTPLLSVLLATLGACPLRAQNTASLVEDLGDAGNFQRRYAAYRNLASTKPPAAIPLLIAALPNYGLSSQSLGISVLSVYPLERAQDAFRRLLKADSPYLVLSAAAYLYRRGEPRRLKEILVSLRAGRDPAELTMMLSRISYIFAADLRAEVRKLVRPETPIAVLNGALYYLLLAKDQASRKAAKKLLVAIDTPAAERPICAAFLASMGDDRGGAYLDQALQGPEPTSLPNLYRFLIRAEKLNKSTLTAISSIVETDRNASQVIYGLRILAAHKHRPALKTIRNLLADSNPQIAKAAYEALASLAEELKASELHELLTAQRPSLVLVAADLLRRMDDLSGLSRVIGLLRKGGKHQAQAAQVLGGFRVAASVEPLLEALDDGDATVRANAFRSLTAVLGSLFPYRRLDLASTGYSPQAERSTRAAGLAKLRAFWVDHRFE